MKLLSPLSAVILAATLLTSCGSGPGRVDARNPSISQMDDLDVQWGLPRRASRGTPKRLFPTTSLESEMSAPLAGVPTQPMLSQPMATPAPTAQPQAPVTVDPSVISKLR